ncbi:MAG: hypothetical protein M0009_14625 [Deltaproteobacteria bacterium]|nr:hypothetical protein [Deltaproteobacteria bacterium]
MGRKIPAIISGLSLMMAAFCPPAGMAGEAKAKPRVAREEPIQIVSDRLDAYNEKRMVVFSGNAVATQGIRTIRADRLIIYYKEEKPEEKRPGTTAAKKQTDAEEMGALDRIEAKGHVIITEAERIVTGEEGVFEQDAQKITMTGDAVMREGNNVIRGNRIVVFIDENRGVVESSENKRVTATIYPNEVKGKKP